MFEAIAEGVKICQGDCLEVMREIPDGSVDMVLCDLPYGTTRNKWDSVIPFEPLWGARIGAKMGDEPNKAHLFELYAKLTEGEDDGR